MITMASSKVMATTSTANPDLPRQHSLCPSLSTLISDLQNHNNVLSSDPSSLNMDDLLKNIYSSPDPHAPPFPGTSLPCPDQDSPSAKSVDEVWKEIVSGGRDPRRPVAEGMTLEDFLTKAGAVSEEDVRGVAVPVGGEYGSETNPNHNQSNTTAINNPSNTNNARLFGGGNGMVMVEAGVAATGGGRGRLVEAGVAATGGGRGRLKRRAVEDAPVDKATQQKQRRMIKNRESAARSRERKQAYTVELESLVTQLEEEHARLLREEAELNKERFKQLMENLVPVIDKQRPPRGGLRRVHSVQW